MNQEWSRYNPQPFHDELMVACQEIRPHSRKLVEYLQHLSRADFCHRVEESERVIREMGITFTIYSDAGNIDRAWPFDIIPRAISGSEWSCTEKGLKQRIRALNMFIQDVYSERRAIRDGVIPEDVVMQSKGYREACVGMTPPHGVWANICGSDLVRHNDGVMYVLEDNLLPISPVSPYPEQLYNMLASLRPDLEQPTIALLTPGIYNSAYFEHASLAQQAGLVLLEGADLTVGKDNYVYMQTIQGLERVDVIYRRIDDDFIDPEVFRKDSMLGVPGIMRAWREGKVAIANAPGCGVADDKVIYAYVPDMIRYFLNEEPSLPNVPTWVCRRPEDRAYVLEHLPELVVKPANESGGYGMLVGPHSTPEKVEEFRILIQENPNNYIAQPTLSLSVNPTWCGDKVAPRHLDLRPFILSGKDIYVTPGGLTRVAMVEGSLVVNSSQGGGSKDTWIVDDQAWEGGVQ